MEGRKEEKNDKPLSNKSLDLALVDEVIASNDLSCVLSSFTHKFPFLNPPNTNLQGQYFCTQLPQNIPINTAAIAGPSTVVFIRLLYPPF